MFAKSRTAQSTTRAGFVVVRRHKRKRKQPPVTLKTVALHTKYFKVLSRAQGYKKAVMVAFLALTVFNIVYAIWEPQPAQAFLFDDLTGVGRAAGGRIMDTSYKIVTDLYNGKYGLLAWLSKTCLYFATPVAAAGIVQYMSEEVPGNPMKRPVVIASVFLVIALSGGGFIFGQLYLLIFGILEGFFKNMDKFMTLYEAIDQGKAYLASNALISAATAECQKFVGQEQRRCISEATTQALGTLNDFQSTYGVNEWITGRKEIFQKIADDLASPDTSLVEKTSNTFFYIFAAPAAELAQAGLATASITAFTAIYACVIAYIGLGGPIAGLSSLLVPGLQSGWVVWLVGIFGLWFWRVSYMAILWFLSKVLLNAVPSDITGTAWFTFSATIVAPIIATGIAGGGAMAVWGGLSGFVAGAVSTLSVGIINSDMVNQGSPPAQPPTQVNYNSAPQGSNTPYVDTNY
jgi:hypothetical protein